MLRSSSEYSCNMREAFWKPALEQFDAILQHNDPWQAMELLEQGDPSMLDSSIIGRRWNSPIFRRALLKLFREYFASKSERYAA